MLSRENFGLDITHCKSFDLAKQVSSMYKIKSKDLMVQETVFNWNHKINYLYNRLLDTKESA